MCIRQQVHRSRDGRLTPQRLSRPPLPQRRYSGISGQLHEEEKRLMHSSEELPLCLRLSHKDSNDSVSGAFTSRRKGSRSESQQNIPGGATLFRTVSAPFVMYVMYRFIIGFTDVWLMGLMPLFAVFALTFSLYTIPLGYLIARVVSRSLKVGNQL